LIDLQLKLNDIALSAADPGLSNSVASATAQTAEDRSRIELF
jgi:hypothetical protein